MPAAPHRRAAGLRWVVVVLGTVLLVTAALVGRPAWSAGGGDGPEGGDAGGDGVTRVLARAAASASVPFTGTATSSGALGLPDLPRLGDVAALVGESTRTRTWWAGEGTWRTDVLTATGERGQYASGGQLTGWDYERDAITVDAPLSGARLPRASDLLPPTLARSLLAGATPEQLVEQGATDIGERVVAGRLADGVRLRTTPTAEQPDASRLSTLDHADVWVDRATGLPLAVDVVDIVGGPVVSAAFDDVALGAPNPAALVVPDPPGASVRTAEVDVAAGAATAAPWALPDQLAGLPALQDPLSTGAVAYGTGLLRLAVVSLPAEQGRQALFAAEAAGADPLDPADDASTPAARTALVRAGALSAAIVVVPDGEGRRERRAYLVSGAVQPELLTRAAAQLVTEPPERRP
ncbi:hypothetical protein SAMN06264364_12160 [Quadrisphaera granulorum]|uniref:Outer membrane lipoprotein-sorting protein n=1 Tax=Quadrisphaera granulorum TaxID=317664 RepID=A0A316A0R9_9ACTN|nr:hypothetical protein [Quadrisphaera granulorum]PWJ51183.1 hypothetical protein BXY45_12160 [Quadrisphaera granulorum]SZE97833.1 hypothetical protein SAMN06264364_12160 [Quadrisphaera granulorum]